MYSIQWATDVVKAHYMAHARASYFLVSQTVLTTNLLARWLAKRDPRWECHKKCVLFVETYPIADTTHMFSKNMLGDMAKFLLESGSMGAVSYLTAAKLDEKLDLSAVSGARSADSRQRRANDPKELPGQLHILF